MKLHLENFRCYESKIFTFEQNKLNLLDGISGKGKTTVLEAILFVLYGKARKVEKFGKKKCSVTLNKENIEIKRQKGPLLLTLIQDGIKYVDSSAQQIIDEIYGDYEIFKNISYIKQGIKHMFFEGSNTEKIEFIRNISFVGDESTKSKKLLKDKIKDTNEDVITLNSECKLLSKMYKTFLNKNKDINQVEDYDQKITYDDVKEKEDKLEELNISFVSAKVKENNITSLKKQINDLKNAINNIDIIDDNDLEQKLEIYQDKINNYDFDWEEKSKNVKINKMKISNLELELKKLNKNVKY